MSHSLLLVLLLSPALSDVHLGITFPRVIGLFAVICRFAPSFHVVMHSHRSSCSAAIDVWANSESYDGLFREEGERCACHEPFRRSHLLRHSLHRFALHHHVLGGLFMRGSRAVSCTRSRMRLLSASRLQRMMSVSSGASMCAYFPHDDSHERDSQRAMFSNEYWGQGKQI